MIAPNNTPPPPPHYGEIMYSLEASVCDYQQNQFVRTPRPNRSMRITLDIRFKYTRIIILVFFPFLKLNRICQISQLFRIPAVTNHATPFMTISELLLLVSNVKLLWWSLLPLTNLTNSRSLQNGKTQLFQEKCFPKSLQLLLSRQDTGTAKFSKPWRNSDPPTHPTFNEIVPLSCNETMWTEGKQFQ